MSQFGVLVCETGHLGPEGLISEWALIEAFRFTEGDLKGLEEAVPPARGAESGTRIWTASAVYRHFSERVNAKSEAGDGEDSRPTAIQAAPAGRR